MKIKRLLISLVAGLGLTLALIWLLVGLSPPVRAQGPDGYSIYYVAPEGVDCGITPCYTNVQAAVDATDDPSDVVKVAAGTYTDTHSRPRRDITSAGLTTQVVYISETVTIRGGYTTTNGFADPPDPKANPTTLNAQEDGRVIYVTGDINAILAGLRIINGRAAGLGGGPQGHDAGGGVYVITAALALSDSQVFGNTANRGGGLYLLNSEAVFIANTLFLRKERRFLFDNANRQGF